ncbi:RNA polymerase sigma factor [Spirosoma spitsbergense]|jgi:RNA polymerase sigma-70 factor (ECF subfamily)|uniref:RNA polymerase sigma factor n=1 Tax=Spirosoma spitsbergense TaxID=431554 RepID=UPI00037FF946|nr:sigma-70 family RNA polymerase sigma factor [Spirosoma spitsbergense]
MLSNTQFETIYNEFGRLVYNLALSYVLNEEDAQDVTQEVFVKVYQRYADYKPHLSSLKTWIYQITINHCLDVIKARRSKKRFGFVTGLFSPDTSEPIPEAAHFDHPGVALENKEAIQRLFALIDTLPDNQRTALILTKIEDRSIKEVADIMQLTPKAIESLLQRAKENFSKKAGRTEGF